MKPPKRTLSINRQLAQILNFAGSDTKTEELLPALINYIEISHQYLRTEFKKGSNVRSLVHSRSRHIDKLLIALWQHLNIDNSIALVAVGGYGRGELHPHSDIDLLILVGPEPAQSDIQKIELMISIMWDCHLKVGQSVRTLAQCIELAQNDLSVATNLMESRLLIGNRALFKQLVQQTTPEKMWDAKSFFIAKSEEQRARYKKYDGSSFDLEPNVKSSPGGLRDIHLIGWIAQRTYYPKTLYQLIKQKLISKNEYYTLIKSRLFIWRVRFALHLVSDKAEDRLLFDYQKSAAKLMGYQDSKGSLAVEKMMKRYYRCVLIVRNICDILMQVMEEELLQNKEVNSAIPIDQYFQVVNQRIDAIDTDLFQKDPSQLLKVFQYVAQDNSLKGITAQTLRAIRNARPKINNSFINNPNNKRLFIEFWHIPHSSSRAMFLMKRSGVLADYLRPFRDITGQMQYDMFHNYTVDEHTLFLLKNLAEFADPHLNEAFPVCSEIMQRQKSPEIIFIAGLFHDIAKGRGGDHSELGAIEARKFCQKHDVNPQHAEKIEWLVANHLIMSLTAQKRDISDPKVIQNFAELVKTQHHLELLYILTVADIRATSHSLWNSWKDSLLKNLYLSTSSYLNQEQQESVEFWRINRKQAKKRLLEQTLHENDIESLWSALDDQYFAKHSVEAITWRSKKIITEKGDDNIVVGIRSTLQKSGSEIFVYSKDRDNLFAALAVTLNQQGLSIQAASIYTDRSGYCYDSFIVLDSDGKALANQYIKMQVKQAIIENILNIDHLELSVQRRMPRQFKYFSIPTKVEFFEDEYTGFTRMELITRDQPGLLAAVGKAFIQTNTRLHDARITTLGEKVEDTFIISNRNNTPITNCQQQEEIRLEIKNQLNIN
ncbi:[protein-PII] uridylyltransferase [Aliikangiella maris]|uniref:Bifunctional uridylyltransferase/uridylyl-removing enzyme n=2 Tax=Aliikangiella maris TaxID=3162458 RepID=A0ABV2BT97_9GAMM